MKRRLLVGLGAFVLLLVGYTTYTIVRPTVRVRSISRV